MRSSKLLRPLVIAVSFVVVFAGGLTNEYLSGHSSVAHATGPFLTATFPDAAGTGLPSDWTENSSTSGSWKQDGIGGAYPDSGSGSNFAYNTAVPPTATYHIDFTFNVLTDEGSTPHYAGVMIRSSRSAGSGIFALWSPDNQGVIMQAVSGGSGRVSIPFSSLGTLVGSHAATLSASGNTYTLTVDGQSTSLTDATLGSTVGSVSLAAIGPVTATTGVHITGLSASGPLAPASAPTFSPAAGGYATPQAVTIASATAGASIRYTTDGSDPTSSSGTVYSGPVSVTSSETLKAIAYHSGFADSSVASAPYMIGPGPFLAAPFPGTSGSSLPSDWITNPGSGGSFMQNGAGGVYDAGNSGAFTVNNYTSVVPTQANYQVDWDFVVSSDLTGQNLYSGVLLHGDSADNAGYPAMWNWNSGDIYLGTVLNSGGSTDIPFSELNSPLVGTHHATETYLNGVVSLVVDGAYVSIDDSTSPAHPAAGLISLAGYEAQSPTTGVQIANLTATYVTAPVITPLPNASVYAKGWFNDSANNRIMQNSPGAKVMFGVSGTTSVKLSTSAGGGAIITPYVDGTARSPITVQTGSGQVTLATGLSTGPHQIAVVLNRLGSTYSYGSRFSGSPPTDSLVLSSILTDTGSTVSYPTNVPAKTIAFMTDSLGEYTTGTAGNGSDTDAALCYPTLLANDLGMTLVSRSFGGQTYYQDRTGSGIAPPVYTPGNESLTSLDKWDSGDTFSSGFRNSLDYLVLAEGTNDEQGGVAGSDLQARVQATVTQARALFPNAKIIVQEPLSHGTGANLDSYIAAGFAAAADANSTLIPVDASLYTSYQFDGVHLTEAGQSHAVSTDLLAKYQVAIQPNNSAPSLSPAAGSVAAGTSVSFSGADAGSTYYYTTDGSTPTTSSASGLSVMLNGLGSVTVKVLAHKAGETDGAVTSAVYTVLMPVEPTPVFSAANGTSLSQGSSVTLSGADSGSTYYYTTDGTTPTTASASGSSIPLNASGTITVKAIAHKAGETDSAMASATYVVQASSFTLSAITALPTASSAVVSWTTSTATSSQVAYGPSAAYGTSTAITDSGSGTTSHNVTLSGLASCVTYHYQVKSTPITRGGATLTGADMSFTTPCPNNVPAAASASSTIARTSGGSLSLLDSGSHGLVLTVPANAAASDAVFQAHQLDSISTAQSFPLPASVSIVGAYAYDLKAVTSQGADLSSFAGPLSLALSYDPASLPAGTDASTLAIYRNEGDGTAWVRLDSTVDAANHTVSAATGSFSIFVLAATAPSTTGTSGGTTPLADTGSSAVPLTLLGLLSGMAGIAVTFLTRRADRRG